MRGNQLQSDAIRGNQWSNSALARGQSSKAISIAISSNVQWMKRATWEGFGRGMQSRHAAPPSNSPTALLDRRQALGPFNKLLGTTCIKLTLHSYYTVLRHSSSLRRTTRRTTQPTGQPSWIHTLHCMTISATCGAGAFISGTGSLEFSTDRLST